jgi:hypothetical protein
MPLWAAFRDTTTTVMNTKHHPMDATSKKSSSSA